MGENNKFKFGLILRRYAVKNEHNFTPKFHLSVTIEIMKFNLLKNTVKWPEKKLNSNNYWLESRISIVEDADEKKDASDETRCRISHEVITNDQNVLERVHSPADLKHSTSTNLTNCSSGRDATNNITKLSGVSSPSPIASRRRRHKKRFRVHRNDLSRYYQRYMKRNIHLLNEREL